MAPSSRLGRQLVEIAQALSRINASFALIGGLALASHSVIRATQDIDLLVALEKSDEIDGEVVKLGYRCLHRSTNAGNYVRGGERLDFLYASRPIALRLLTDAKQLTTSLGAIRVIGLEGLIGFKLQGFVNDPRRTQDLEDIRALMRANRNRLDLQQVRQYFCLFDKEPLLDELLQQIN